MRAVLYARVSTDEQAKKYGLSSQLHELQQHAARKGYTIVATFADEGQSGATMDRPALRRLRDAVQARTLDVVLIHDPDRLSRHLPDLLVLEDEFERAGVVIDYYTTPVDKTPEGELLLRVKGIIGEYERKKIRERTSRGKRERARRGLSPGGTAPYGWRANPEVPGTCVVDPDQAEVIRLIFAMLLDEQRSIRAIATELQRLGVPSPRGRTWSRSFIHAVLTNPRVIGRWTFNERVFYRAPAGRRFRRRQAEEHITIPLPPIVDAERFRQARAALERNSLLASGRPAAAFFLLRGLVKCGACGRRMHGAAWTQGRRREYRCPGRDRLEGVGCRTPDLPADSFERRVWETVAGVLRRPDLLAAKLDAYRATIGAVEVEVASAAAALRGKLVQLDRHTGRLLDVLAGLDDVAVPPVRERLLALGRERAGIEERLAALDAQRARQGAEEDRQQAIEAMCEQVVRGLDELDAEERRRLLRTLIDEILVKPNIVEIHGVLPADLIPENRSEHGHAANSIPGHRYVVTIPWGRPDEAS